jgi:hypothetical protein
MYDTVASLAWFLYATAGIHGSITHPLFTWPPVFGGSLLLNFSMAKTFNGAAIFEYSFELIYAKYAAEWGQVDKVWQEFREMSIRRYY